MATSENFSLVLGGPLYQLLLRARLLEPPIRFVERRIAVVIAVTWLPVFALAALGGTLFAGAGCSSPPSRWCTGSSRCRCASSTSAA